MLDNIFELEGFVYIGKRMYTCGSLQNTMHEYCHEQTGMEFVYIPGGTFMMGSNEYDYTKPVHVVKLTPYLIAKTQTTQDVWQKIMGSNPSFFQNVGSDAPVEQISWDDCQKFCQKTGLSLPTEAQWEYAARGGSKGKWAHGNDESQLMQYAWYEKHANITTHPVAMLAPNAYGLYDMSGNVWEWCQDWYDSYPSSSTDLPLVNPVGSTFGSDRVIRGGSWCSDADICWVASRGSNLFNIRDSDVGVRFVQVYEHALDSKIILGKEAEDASYS